MKIVDLEEMNALEKQSFEEYGFTESLVIENVGLKAAHFLEQNYLNKNNFGDGNAKSSGRDRTSTYDITNTDW